MPELIDKTDGGKGCIDCKVLEMGDTDGCGNCIHKNDLVYECKKINADNAYKKVHKQCIGEGMSEKDAGTHAFLDAWGYKPIKL